MAGSAAINTEESKAILPSKGGTSSVRKGGKGEMFMGGNKGGTKSAGLGRFDVTNKSLNRGGRSMR